MRKITTLIMLIIIINCQIVSQSCLPHGINLNSQELIDNFQTNYPNCSEIEGSVMISDQGANNISNLNGLSTITAIGGYLVIGQNNNLIDLNGLENLNSIGASLEIDYNNSLSDLTALDNLTNIGGDLHISNNNSLNNLLGLNNIVTIGGALNISQCSDLLGLTGLEGVNSVGGALIINLNPNLTTINGLENITSIGDLLGIGYNYKLTSLSGLNSVTSIGSHLYIWHNDSLVSIQGLQNVTSINGSIRITQNHSLLSLEGINNISAASIERLEIYINSSLSTCEVESVCNYLTNSMGDVSIGGNTSGCDSIQEVLDACIVGINTNIEDNFTIYPNPADKIIMISNKTNSSIDYVIIHNHLGQKVLIQKIGSGTIDISKLQKGLHFVELHSGELKIRKKLIIN